MKFNHLVIEGNIGTGKTTFVQKLASKINVRAIYEQFEDNDFLPKFYADPDKYGFTLEMSFLAERYHQLNRDLNRQDMFTDGIVSDYFLMKSLIFARSTLKEDEYRLYRDVFEIIYQRLPQPSLYVYLHKTPKQLLYNINARGRSYEKSITKEYLKSLEESYFTFFKQHPELNVLIIDTEDLDFVANEKDFDKICEIIKDKLSET